MINRFFSKYLSNFMKDFDMKYRMQVLVFFCLLVLGIGYAAISTTLTIVGNSFLRGDEANFADNVFFENASLSSNAIRAEDLTVSQPQINGNTMNFFIPSTSALKVSGDKIEVTYKIRNESNYKAALDVPIVEYFDSSMNEYFTVSHSRDEEIILDPNQSTDTQKLVLTLKKTYSDQTPKTFVFTARINATALDSASSGANNRNGVKSNVLNKISGNGHTIGSEVNIGTESFYVIGEDNDDNTLLFSKYNLAVGNLYDGNEFINLNQLNYTFGIQNSNSLGKTDDVISPLNPVVGVTAFANSNYWNNGSYGSSAPYYVYDQNSLIYEHINRYKTYLTNLGLKVEDVRLIKVEELNDLGCVSSDRSCDGAPSFVSSSTYFTGSAQSSSAIWAVSSKNKNLDYVGYNTNDSYGVRPVIVVKSSLLN